MKQILIAFVFLVVSSVSYGQVNFCVAKARGPFHMNGKVIPDGGIIASVPEARVRAQGKTCDEWRQDLKQTHFGGCRLLANGKFIFNNEATPRKPEEVVAEGFPKPGQTCDQWRQEKAEEIVTGAVE